ncbi:MAG: hypothetical protein A2218_04175 [Elusimicrobia bacterium RIFOXYA2_FULL_53_38]|nr:MAG: hypothetical protein A2218_04175 [Elusimicrobia bacterium RIFOXYA2_FULL_53_38]
MKRKLCKKDGNISVHYPLFYILVFFTLPAGAVNVSTHSFANCDFPDTGEAACFNNTTNIACPTVGQDFYGQDATYGTHSRTWPSYTIYNPTGISSVTVDNRTGLMWITNPRNDAGFVTTQNWQSALSSCAVTMNAGSGYGGYTDWRLPNVQELMSILYFGTYNPAISSTYFPGTVSDWYWTSTTAVWSPNGAILLYFASGRLATGAKATSLYWVRCVRGGF